MANVIRGRSFAPAATVTADSLNQLVRNAQITGLTFADFAGANIQWISAHTAPTDAGVGWLTSGFEWLSRNLASGPTAVNLIYFLRVHSTGTSNADVGLFNPYRIETRRGGIRALFANDCQPGHIRCAQSPAPALPWHMMTDRGQSQQRRRVLGAALETGLSSASSPDYGNAYPRTGLWGIVPARVGTVNWDATTWADARALSVDALGHWEARGGLAITHVTQAGYWHGYLLRNNSNAAVQIQPAFLFGGFILVVS